MRQRDLASLDTLSRVANDLAGEFRLEPLLELILRSSVTLLGCESGSLCLVEPHTHTYRKQIDMQAGCQAGRAFPLEEGVTGAVARAGRPVTFRHYADVPGGHVSADSPLYNRAVIGVTIRLRSDLLGSLVVFAPDDEYCFGDADAQLLQRFATHAAIAMANARLHAEAADRAKAAAVWAERERSMLDVHDALGHGAAGVGARGRAGRRGLAGIRDRAVSLGGAAYVESVPGEGTTISVHLPIVSRRVAP